MLFGVRTEGQLGGRNELLDAQNLFNSIYVRPLRSLIDGRLKALLGIDYDVKDLNVMTQDVTQLKGILTIDEIREALGYKPLNNEQKQDVEQLKSEALKRLKELKTTKHLEIKYSSDVDVNDISKDSEMRLLLSKRFGILSEQDIQILKWLLRDKNIDNRLLANIVGISTPTLNKAISVLQEEGYLDENRMLTQKGINALASTERGDAYVTAVRYSYEWSYGFSNKDRKTSRDFCKALMDESEQRKQRGELWKREDIEQISSEVGWNVWTMRGGWYRVPGTEVSIPHCRHEWKQHITIEKNN
jgi:DNA-binding MarR family transcriptional regulator